jgi:hypothetical protein
MKFKTSEEIRKEKEAREKNSHRDEKLKAKLEEKAQRKYAAMAEASAKREKSRVVKPKITILPGVIVAPALLASKKEIQQVIKAESKFYGGKTVTTGRLSSKDMNLSNRPKAAPKANASQVWDDATKQWVKR